MIIQIGLFLFKINIKLNVLFQKFEYRRTYYHGKNIMWFQIILDFLKNHMKNLFVKSILLFFYLKDNRLDFTRNTFTKSNTTVATTLWKCYRCLFFYNNWMLFDSVLNVIFNGNRASWFYFISIMMYTILFSISLLQAFKMCRQFLNVSSVRTHFLTIQSWKCVG